MHRCQIPFVVDTLEENPEGSGKLVSRPVVGATVVVENRVKAESVVVYAVENPEESGTVVPTTDSNGRIHGWLKEGSYTIKVTGGTPYIAPTTIAFEALSGRGVEYTNVEAITLTELVKSVQESLVPAGAMFDYGGTVAPAGFLLQDGKGYANTEYPALFAAIEYNFGKPSAGHFNVPDSRGRVKVGTGSGSGLTVRTIGATGGAETVTLSIGELPAHSHGATSSKISINSSTTGVSVQGTTISSDLEALFVMGGPAAPGPEFKTSDSQGERSLWYGTIGYHNHGHGISDPGHAHGVSDPTHTHTSEGGNGSHNNTQPFTVATGIIKF